MTRLRWTALVLLLAACGDDADPTKCEPGAVEECGCLGGALGEQVCNDDGDAYGPCECPDAGGPMGLGSNLIRGEEPMAEEGISCGVGLARLCELGSEICCVRSLTTDSCVAADGACECELPDCGTTEIRCDGPEDCPEGQVCCGTFSITTDLAAGAVAAYTSVECADSCSTSGTQRIICHAGIDECEGEAECKSSQLLTNLQVCTEPSM